MREARHVVVFVKAPRLGAVKTRLARGIGALAAQRFYLTTTRRVLGRLAGDPRWRCHLAVTPDRLATATTVPWPRGLPRLPQGAGDLGARMARPLRELPAGPVVVVGSDIPDLAADHVAAAFRALDSHDVVFGPARDGGYWLVGVSRRRRLPVGAFAGVRWSSRHALADTLANLAGKRIALLEMLSDVDTAADYHRWRQGSPSSRISRPCA